MPFPNTLTDAQRIRLADTLRNAAEMLERAESVKGTCEIEADMDTSVEHGYITSTPTDTHTLTANLTWQMPASEDTTK